MKKVFNWQVILGLSLIVLSALIYTIHYVIFRDTHHICIYGVGDIAFVPIEVLLVTLIIHRLLSTREKRRILHKMNMAIGVFFSELGAGLLKKIWSSVKNSEEIAVHLNVKTEWTGKDFRYARTAIAGSEIEADSRSIDLVMLRDFLWGKRILMLQLLQNQALLEHESFTNLMWAVSHLSEELHARESLEGLPRADYDHLSNDMKRVCTNLFREWLSYMEHLRNSYPFLFSFAVRTNPLDPGASPIVRET